MASRAKEHLGSFLEGGLGDRTDIIIVDSVAEDGDHRIIAGHAVAQYAQVVVVNVSTVECQNLLDFIEDSLASSFDPESAVDLLDVVGESPVDIDIVQS